MYLPISATMTAKERIRPAIGCNVGQSNQISMKHKFVVSLTEHIYQAGNLYI